MIAVDVCEREREWIVHLPFVCQKAIPRELAAYLYSGVTAVRSVGDPLDEAKKWRQAINAGARQGAELFLCGPMFTTAGGHGTEYFKALPDNIRKMAEAQTVRLPKSADEARAMVAALKGEDVNGIKAILEAGTSGMLFNRMDTGILRAIGEEARARDGPRSPSEPGWPSPATLAAAFSG